MILLYLKNSFQMIIRKKLILRAGGILRTKIHQPINGLYFNRNIENYVFIDTTAIPINFGIISLGYTLYGDQYYYYYYNITFVIINITSQ